VITYRSLAVTSRRDNGSPRKARILGALSLTYKDTSILKVSLNSDMVRPETRAVFRLIAILETFLFRSWRSKILFDKLV
jgi:hypothetical protein